MNASPHYDRESLVSQRFTSAPLTTGRERVVCDVPFSTRRYCRTMAEAFNDADRATGSHSPIYSEEHNGLGWWAAGIALALALSGACMYLPWSAS